MTGGRGRRPRTGQRPIAFMLLAGCASCGAAERSEAVGAAETSAVVHEPLSDTAGFVVVGETRVSYRSLGEGHPVVVVHGGPALDQQYLRPWLDSISGFARVIYYDQRGTGGSTGPLDVENVNFDAFVEDIDALRAAFGYEALTVLGHSWGGVVATAYALRQPARLSGLILMNTAEPGSRFAAQTAQNQMEMRSADDASLIQELAASEALAQGDPEVTSRLFQAAFRGTLADPADLSLLNLDIAPRTAMNRGQVGELLGQTMVSPDWWVDLETLAVPTLVVHGLHDPVPVEMARALDETIPESRLFVVRDAGHFPFAESPRATLGAVREFVESLER